MSHYRRGGEIVGWGPTVQEIDVLAGLFDEVRHLGFLHEGKAPDSALPYTAENVRFIPVRPAGGKRFVDKLGIVRSFPAYARIMLRELSQVDAVHMRGPANICVLALLLLALRRTPPLRWYKYAGNWLPYAGEAWSYKIQRWWVKKGLGGGVVTVNGAWPDQPAHVYSFLNPCLTEEEINSARAIAERKHLSEPVRLLFVGALTREKGGDRALEVLAHLLQEEVSARLEIVGDGAERARLEAQTQALDIEHHVTFHGWVARTHLAPYYSDAHILILPSKTEGWPKVISEAMAYGVVPVASRVGSIPQYLEQFACGQTFADTDVVSFSNAIATYAHEPGRWKKESQQALKAAPLFSYTAYAKAVQRLLDFPMKLEKPIPAAPVSLE